MRNHIKIRFRKMPNKNKHIRDDKELHTIRLLQPYCFNTTYRLHGRPEVPRCLQQSSAMVPCRQRCGALHGTTVDLGGACCRCIGPLLLVTPRFSRSDCVASMKALPSLMIYSIFFVFFSFFSLVASLSDYLITSIRSSQRLLAFLV